MFRWYLLTYFRQSKSHFHSFTQVRSRFHPCAPRNHLHLLDGSEVVVEAFFTPKEFEFAVEVKFPSAARGGGGEHGGEVGFHFEIGHRRCDKKDEDGGKLDHDDSYSKECHQDNHDWDEKQAAGNPPTTWIYT
jgi:hypothetical protein